MPGGFTPDFTSRYFTEDFPYGTRFTVETTHTHHVPIPTIEEVYRWGMSKTASELLYLQLLQTQ